MDEEIVAEVKAGAKATWSAGDFDEIAQLIWGVGPRLVDRIGVSAGQDVLDIAAGTGNAAIPAAEAGASVVASDLVPGLFDAGRRNAAEAGVEVDWVEADAEDLPFDDASFDIALSSFGIMFAPRHQVAASEVARVLRPGGRLGLTCWRPEGGVGSFFKTVATHMPPPEGFAPPVMWGTREHVEGLFGEHGFSFDFDEDEAHFEFESAESALELYAAKFGPVVRAREALQAEGEERWQALRADMIELFESESERTADGGIRYVGEYLTVIGTKAG